MMKTTPLWLVTAACVAIVWVAPAHAAPREEAEIRALLAGWAPAGTRRMAPAYARAPRRRGACGLARRP